MKDYIERAELYEAMNSQNCEFSLIDALALIENFPASDVSEVRHGIWTDIGSLSCRCSECGCKNNRTTPYCPLCGARMDKEK